MPVHVPLRQHPISALARLGRWLTLALALVLAWPASAWLQTAATPSCALVLMHGKWGGPQGLAVFANKVESTCHVVQLEMPWSGRRAYDQRYTVALKEISAQVQTLRGKGYRQVPVLWVIGTQDPLYPAGEAYAYAKLPAHAKSRYLVVDAGHGNTPEVAAAAVVEWLKGLE